MMRLREEGQRIAREESRRRANLDKALKLKAAETERELERERKELVR